jgi:hypothetical protein
MDVCATRGCSDIVRGHLWIMEMWYNFNFPFIHTISMCYFEANGGTKLFLKCTEDLQPPHRQPDLTSTIICGWEMGHKIPGPNSFPFPLPLYLVCSCSHRGQSEPCDLLTLRLAHDSFWPMECRKRWQLWTLCLGLKRLCLSHVSFCASVFAMGRCATHGADHHLNPQNCPTHLQMEGRPMLAILNHSDSVVIYYTAVAADTVWLKCFP